MNYHNVIILGAGASCNAGIPLLNSFLDKMWEYAARGKRGGERLSDKDIEVFKNANSIRRDLERYNARAAFDYRNLEDILSLLSFEALGNDAGKLSYETMVKAVARTIELSCTIRHSDEPLNQPPGGNFYTTFWSTLLRSQNRNNLPALITFNYDLVLERSLWQCFHHYKGGSPIGELTSCGLKYFFGENDFSLKLVPHEYTRNGGPASGYKARYTTNQQTEVEIPYLKLHGSLNWDNNNPLVQPPHYRTAAEEIPFILPPVFNKMNRPEVNRLWSKALDVLRTAKHIIIVGYSLPRTDIYMQYFLKSAVGPNSDLQKISVFNPMLYQDSPQAKEMKSRYLECFSPQFHTSMIFQPQAPWRFGDERLGTFLHFIESMGLNTLFFEP